MAKVKRYDVHWDDGDHVAICCPGCMAAFPDGHGLHLLNVTTIHCWNGDCEKPTFTPSLMWNHEFGGMGQVAV